MRIKSFKVFENLKSQLGEIEDLIQSEILDEYDSELILLDTGEIEEGISTKYCGVVKRVKFPSSKKFIGYEYYIQESEFSVPLQKKDLGGILKDGDISNFIIIIIDFTVDKNFIDKNFTDLYRKFRSTYKRISSMTGLNNFDINGSKDFEKNGIIFGISDFDFVLGKLKLNWEDSGEDDVNKLANQSMSKFSKAIEDHPDIYVENDLKASFTLILR